MSPEERVQKKGSPRTETDIGFRKNLDLRGGNGVGSHTLLLDSRDHNDDFSSV